jgi:hypothetical protein
VTTRATGTRRVRGAHLLSWASSALLGLTGLLGASTALSALAAWRDPASAAQADLATFLWRCREIVRPGERAVVVTTIFPVLDFDYWVGHGVPARVLIPMDERTLAELGPPAPAEALAAALAAARAGLRARGQLFDEETLAAALPGARYVVVTDELAAQALARARPALLAGAIVQSGPLALVRLAPR